nr:hypothetical protein Iba_chr02eCG10150 [Ipomoea batatas]
MSGKLWKNHLAVNAHFGSENPDKEKVGDGKVRTITERAYWDGTGVQRVKSLDPSMLYTVSVNASFTLTPVATEERKNMIGWDQKTADSACVSFSLPRFFEFSENPLTVNSQWALWQRFCIFPWSEE